ncbi:hypothetical protein HDV06_001560 [Boothiomyces sp. JEL0866]|nr:hypothetical protein HDV06_001560 [Boothiomyces sp. JEL0866]
MFTVENTTNVPLNVLLTRFIPVIGYVPCQHKWGLNPGEKHQFRQTTGRRVTVWMDNGEGTRISDTALKAWVGGKVVIAGVSFGAHATLDHMVSDLVLDSIIGHLITHVIDSHVSSLLISHVIEHLTMEFIADQLVDAALYPFVRLAEAKIEKDGIAKSHAKIDLGNLVGVKIKPGKHLIHHTNLNGCEMIVTGGPGIEIVEKDGEQYVTWVCKDDVQKEFEIVKHSALGNVVRKAAGVITSATNAIIGEKF